MDKIKPLRASGLISQDMEDELLLYDSERETIHTLNPTARLIWELCDGDHTVVDMEHAVRVSFSVPDDHDVIGDIQTTLQTFAAKGLLEPEP